MNKYITLHQLQSIVSDAIERSTEPNYWVVAEISEINVNYSGHCYMELVEKSERSNQPKAKARAVIWSSRYPMLSGYFEQTTSTKLRSGIKVLVSLSVSFHPVYGLSYVIDNIDPTYTLGDIEKQRQQTIAALRVDGVYEMNGELEMPLVADRIAVISSPNAAGYRDFMNELSGNIYGYHFSVSLFEAVMQGDAAQHSIVSAFERIDDAMMQGSVFDVVVLIRGGGSVSDLSCFDSYDIASVVCQFPIPVISGIGHDKDVSVVDMVSNISLKTPTAVAQYIVSLSLQFGNSIDGYMFQIRNSATSSLARCKYDLSLYSGEIDRLARDVIGDVKSRLERYVGQLSILSKHFIEGEAKHIDSTISEVVQCSDRILIQHRGDMDRLGISLKRDSLQSVVNESYRLQSLMADVEMYNPRRILEQGYSIVRIAGRMVGAASDILENDRVQIVFKDSVVEANMVNIKIK